MRPRRSVAVLAPNRLEVPVLMLAVMQLGARGRAAEPRGAARGLELHRRARAGARLLRDARARSRSSRSATACSRARSTSSAIAAAPGRRRTRPTRGAPRSSSTPRAPPAAPKGVALAQQSLLANAWSMAANFGSFETHAARGAAALSRARVRLRPHDGADHRRPPRVRRSLRSVRVARARPRARRGGTRAWCRRCCRRSCRSRSPPRACRRCARSWCRRRRSASTWRASSRAAPGSRSSRAGGSRSTRTSRAACRPTSDPEERDYLMYGLEVPSVGSALAGTEVRVVDGAGARAAAGRARRAVRARATARCSRYLDDPGATRAALDADRWLHTGDEGFHVDARRQARASSSPAGSRRSSSAAARSTARSRSSA